MAEPRRAVERGMPEDRATGPDARLTGILLMCVAVACFACMDAAAKWLGRSFDPIFVTWARYASNMAVVALVLNPWTTPGLLRSNRLGLQLVRSVVLLASTVLNFIALQYLQLAESMSIQFTMPLIVALLAGPLLGEWPGRRRLAIVAVGFVGVIVIARPGTGSVHPAVLLSLANAVLYAIYALLTRKLAAHDKASTTIFFSALAGAVLLTPLVPVVGSMPGSATAWVLLVGMGVLGAAGHGLLILAHARAPAPVLSPFVYTQIVWMTALGFLVFGDVPDGPTILGGSIVIASGLLLLLWERRRRP